MKKLLLSLMVLATLASCGKDNKVSSTTATTPTTVTNPLVTGSTQAQALVTMINNPSSFGQGQILLGGGSSQNCQTKWTIFYYCTSTSSMSASSTTTWNQLVAQNPNLVYQYSNGTTVRHADVNVANKQSELISLLNSATNIQVSGYIFYVTVGSNYYVIDARYPIQANPSGAYANGSQYYLVQAI